MTVRMGENKTEVDCADKERTQTVYVKCEANPWVVSARLNDSRYR